MVTAKIAATIQKSGPRKIFPARVVGAFLGVFLSLFGAVELFFFSKFLPAIFFFSISESAVLTSTCALRAHR